MGYGFGYNNVSTSTEGTLFIDLIDAHKKELAWQGIGKGILSDSRSIDKKVAKINEIVSKIMTEYPPEMEEVANN
jgi:hypothetical protein